MSNRTLKATRDQGCGTRNAPPAAADDTAAEPFINKREVARRMGRTVRTVDKLMREGLIPYYKFDWRVAFRWSEVQAHLAQTCRFCQQPGGLAR